MSLVDLGVLKLSPKQDVYERLGHIHDKVASLIRQYKPSQFAIEAPFFGKNVQSMLKLGRAQGVAIAAAMQAGLPVCEYSPKKVKQSITGNGNAGKEQVLKMLEKLLHFEGADHYLDASDALAVVTPDRVRSCWRKARPLVEKMNGIRSSPHGPPGSTASPSSLTPRE